MKKYAITVLFIMLLMIFAIASCDARKPARDIFIENEQKIYLHVEHKCELIIDANYDLEELYPGKIDQRVSDIWHRVVRVSSEPKAPRKNIRLGDGEICDASAIFDNISELVTTNDVKDSLINVRTPRYTGVQTRFTPKVPGIYVIYSAWTFGNGSIVTSSPLVLSVSKRD